MLRFLPTRVCVCQIACLALILGGWLAGRVFGQEPGQLGLPQESQQLLRPSQILADIPRGQGVPAVQVEQPVLPPPKVLPPKQDTFLEQIVDPDRTLDIFLGIPRLLVLKEAPKRVQIGGEDKSIMATITVISERELSILGKKVGRTVLNMWFADPKDATKLKVVSYLVRIQPDMQMQKSAQQSLQLFYNELEKDINQAFPDSRVCLKLVGRNLVVSGQARDVAEATQILRILNPRIGSQGQGQGQTTVVQHGIDQTILQNLPPEEMEEAQEPKPGKEIEGAFARQTPFINIVNLLRIPGEQQVMLKVVVAEVNRAAVRSLGVNFSLTNQQGVTVFANRTGGLLQGTGVGVQNPLVNLPTVLDNGQFVLAINALKTLNLAKSLAEPNLVASNGQRASFQAGGAFPVPIVTGFTSSGLQGVNFVPFGVNLAFTPVITDKDRVRLNLNAEVSTRDNQNSASVNGTSVPSLNTRNFQTVVELREGQTLAVAGLIQHNYGADATRVPFFGELPVIGKLAAFDRSSTGEQELVILVTPELVHPLEGHETKKLPGMDIVEPSDVEFYLLGRLESHRQVDYRTPVRTDWQRIMHYRDVERQLIAGPQGYSTEGN
jgi:pilus assembly protein CpaC